MKNIIIIIAFTTLIVNGKIFDFIDDIKKKREAKARDEHVKKHGSVFDFADQELMKQ